MNSECNCLENFGKSDMKRRGRFGFIVVSVLCIYWRRYCCRKGYLEWMRFLLRISGLGTFEV